MHKSRRLALLCLSAPVWLAACASITPTRQFDAGETARARDLSGRFAANYVRYGREEGVQGSFQWHEQGRNVRLDLISPLGQTLAVVTSTPSGATLDLPNQPPRNARGGQPGWYGGGGSPGRGRAWPAGLPAPPAPAPPARTTRDDSGRLATLAQNGWTVRYVSWQETPAAATAATALPRRIDLARDGDGSPLSVRLVIDPEQAQ